MRTPSRCLIQRQLGRVILSSGVSARVATPRSGGEAQAAGSSQSAGMDERGVDEAGVQRAEGIREGLSRPMNAAAASSGSRCLLSRRLMITRARRARSAGVPSLSRIPGDYFIAGVGIVGLDGVEQTLELGGQQRRQGEGQREIALGELEQIVEQLARLTVIEVSE
jgi:hypothetical protein